MEVAPTGAAYVLMYAGTECQLAKLVPTGTNGWLNAYMYPLGPASCDAMSIAANGDVLVGRKGLLNETYVQVFSDAAGFPESTRIINVPHLARVAKLRVDAAGNVYTLGGCQQEFNGDLWPLPGGLSPEPTGGACRFPSGDVQWLFTVTNVDGDLTYGTFLGSLSNFAVEAFEVDDHGSAYVAGITGEDGLTNVTPNAVQPVAGISTCSGTCTDSDAFLMVINTSGALTGPDSLLYSSFLGGGAGEFTVSLLRNPDGTIYLTGVTQSDNFPLTTGGPVARNSVFVTRLDLTQSGSSQLLSSVLAMDTPLTSLSEPPQVRLLADGRLAFLAETSSTSFPLVRPLFSAPPAGGNAKPLLFVYNPTSATIPFASFLDDVQRAAYPRIAADSSGHLLVGFATTEDGRSTDGSTQQGQADVLILGLTPPTGANQPPAVTNLTAQQVVATSPDGVIVQLAAIADDPDADALTAVWTGPFGTMTNAWPAASGLATFSGAVRLPIGLSSITLKVDDGTGGHVVTETFDVTVSGENAISGNFAGNPLLVKPPDDNLTHGTGVTAGKVDVAFKGQVNTPGLVWLRTRTDQIPPPPSGMQLGSSPFYYDIGFLPSAVTGVPPVEGLVQICIDYSGMSFVDPENIQLFSLVNGTWSPVTGTTSITNSGDYKFRMLCADRSADVAFGTYALFTEADAATAITTIAANFEDPVSAIYDVNPASNRNYLYIADGFAFYVYRRNLSDGTTTIVAGDGAIGLNPPDNVDATQSHVGPYGLAVDRFGNLFIADASHCSIRRVDAVTHIITTVAGMRTNEENLCGHAGDGGPGNAARVGRAGHLAFDAAGNLIFVDEWTPTAGPVIAYLRRLAAVNGVIPPDGSAIISTIAGNGSSDPPVEGAHPLSSGAYAYDLAFGPDGNLYVSTVAAIFRLVRGAGGDRVIDGSGDERFERVAGGNFGFAYLLPFAGDGGLARDAFLQNPFSIAVLPNGDLLYAETFMNRIRRISGGADHLVNGVNAASCVTDDADCERITTIAGFTDNAGAVFPPPSNGDGLALQTRLGYPIHLALDPDGKGFAMVEVGQGFTRVRHVGINDGPALPPPNPIGVTLLNPLAGVKVFASVPVNVQWQSSGAPTSFAVELSRTAADPFVAIAGCDSLPGSARSCVWVPTGPFTAEARIRVTARNAFQTVSDTSGPFQIAITPPLVTVTIPNTAVRWTIGSTQLIRWNHNLGAEAFVRVELSRDGGVSWETLGAPMHNITASDGMVDWQVTGPPTANALIRVTWTHGAATDTSNVPFAIEDPRITVTAPNGGQVWQLDSARTITWTHNLGTNVPMAIELSRDGGASWTTLADSISNSGATTGQFPWVVTGPVTSQARVRVRTANGTVKDDSDANFAIPSRIRVTSPNSNVKWAVGTPQLVTWKHTYETTQLFDVEVSTDGGATWTMGAHDVEAPTVGQGSATITMPAVPTTQALVRVRPSGHPELGDVSDVPFTLVAPSITVTAPSTGISVALGSTLTIRWAHNLGSLAPFDVSLSRDGGINWTEIAHHVSGVNTFDWQATAPVTTHARVRVAWAGALASAEDISDVDFRIASLVHVDYPNTAISWVAGSQQRVAWTHPFGAAQRFDIDVSTDNGFSWMPGARDVPSTGETFGSAAIPLPNVLTTQALVRIYQAGRPDEADTSDVPFSLVAATIRVATPSSNVNWVLDSSHSIYWTHNLGSSLLNRFDIAVSYDSGQTWAGIANQVNNGYNFYSWIVTGSVTDHARIRVRWTDGTASAEDISDVDFTISSRIHVDYPNAALTWAAGSQQRVSWTHNYGGTQAFDIDVSTDRGISWMAAARNVQATGETFGSATITLPNVLTSGAFIRVNPAGRTDQGDVNDAALTLVAATIHVTTPNSNVNWVLGSGHSIYWTHNLGSSLLNRFDIAVSYDSGQTWAGIANQVNNGYNFYSWIVTGSVTDRARIRVRWTDGTASAEDISDVDFTISSRIRVDYPNAALTWAAGSQQRVSWTHNYGGTQAFDIDVSTDRGINWMAAARNVLATGETFGSAAITLPNVLTSDAFIRVNPAGRTDQGDVNDAALTLVAATIHVTTPNSNVNWLVGSSHSIYWTHNLGSTLLNRFDIAVSYDSGQTWAGIANQVNNGYNFYSWVVTGAVTDRARVRVRWTDGTASAEDISDVDFTISARVRVTSPNTAVTWLAASTHTITWTHNYTATQTFDVDISPDGGATWARLVSAVPADSATTGSFVIVTPGYVTNQALVRVTASGQTRASDSDTSDVPFTILPARIILP